MNVRKEKRCVHDIVTPGCKFMTLKITTGATFGVDIVQNCVIFP